MFSRSLLVLLFLVITLLTSHGLQLRMMAGGPIRADTLPKLLSMAEASNKGVLKGDNESIIALFISIEEAQRSFVLRDAKFYEKLSGTWELLWTTEKETLLFQEKGFFGSPCTRITQTIDLQNSYLNNLIEFDNKRSFSVVGEISKDTKKKTRLNFAFKKAVISVPPLPTLTLPPIGKGWFETVYVNEKYRLSKDIRGDFLVSKRIA